MTSKDPCLLLKSKIFTFFNKFRWISAYRMFSRLSLQRTASVDELLPLLLEVCKFEAFFKFNKLREHQDTKHLAQTIQGWFLFKFDKAIGISMEELFKPEVIAIDWEVLLNFWKISSKDERRFSLESSSQLSRSIASLNWGPGRHSSSTLKKPFYKGKFDLSPAGSLACHWARLLAASKMEIEFDRV